MEQFKHPKFVKADAIVLKILKWISYPPAVMMVIVALLATINVITSKFSHIMVPSCNDWITYLLIPIVFMSIGHVHLDRGLVVVDFVNKHYPKWLLTIIDIVSNILLIGLNGFIGWRAYVLMADNFAAKAWSSTSAGKFYIWPFNFLLGTGMVIFAFTSFWCILRDIFDYHPEVMPNPAEIAKEIEKEKGGDE